MIGHDLWFFSLALSTGNFPDDDREQGIFSWLTLRYSMGKHLIILTYFASLFLTGCTAIKDAMPSIYRIDIDQGNIIAQKMIDQLEPGMNERQVRYIMGTSLLVDAFHQNRWDYLYSEKPGEGGPRTQKRISLYFEDDKLVGIQGDFRPDNLAVSEPTQDTTVVVPKIQREKTLGQKIKGVFGIDEE